MAPKESKTCSKWLLAGILVAGVLASAAPAARADVSGLKAEFFNNVWTQCVSCQNITDFKSVCMEFNGVVAASMNATCFGQLIKGLNDSSLSALVSGSISSNPSTLSYIRASLDDPSTVESYVNTFVPTPSFLEAQVSGFLTNNTLPKSCPAKSDLQKILCSKEVLRIQAQCAFNGDARKLYGPYDVLKTDDSNADHTAYSVLTPVKIGIQNGTAGVPGPFLCQSTDLQLVSDACLPSGTDNLVSSWLLPSCDCYPSVPDFLNQTNYLACPVTSSPALNGSMEQMKLEFFNAVWEQCVSCGIASGYTDICPENNGLYTSSMNVTCFEQLVRGLNDTALSALAGELTTNPQVVAGFKQQFDIPGFFEGYANTFVPTPSFIEKQVTDFLKNKLPPKCLSKNQTMDMLCNTYGLRVQAHCAADGAGRQYYGTYNVLKTDYSSKEYNAFSALVPVKELVANGSVNGSLICQSTDIQLAADACVPLDTDYIVATFLRPFCNCFPSVADMLNNANYLSCNTLISTSPAPAPGPEGSMTPAPAPGPSNSGARHLGSSSILLAVAVAIVHFLL